MIERLIEKSLFASRWLLAPFFIALALGLVVLLAKMLQAFYRIRLARLERQRSERDSRAFSA